MKHILAFGHKNPDTDSICSSIAFASLREQLGDNIKPYRLGEVSKETKFVLDRFGFEVPKLLTTVSAQISDLTHVEKKVINYQESLKNALDVMTTENFSSLPVVDEKKHLKGMIHVSYIANTYLNLNHEDLFSKYQTTYENLLSSISGDVVSGKYPQGIITGNLRAISEVDKIEKGDIVLMTSVIEKIDFAIEAGARVIIVCCGEDDVVTPRKNSDCAIISVKASLFKVIRLISQSISISSIMNVSNFYSFKTDDYLYEIKDIMKEADQTNFPVVNAHGEVYGTIRTKNLINFTKKQVVLLDHNESTQSVDGLRDAKVLQVIDHHKFGNFETSEPVKINAETVGSTCTIVYGLYKEAGIVPSKEIAGLLMSAILSDTLLFKSPTCTEKDKATVEELGKLAGIEDYEKYGMEMLIAGSSFDDMEAEEILFIDSKNFNMNGHSIAISQINSVDVAGLLKRKDEIMKTMEKHLKAENHNLFILAITDIINTGSELIVIGDAPNIVERAFDVKIKDNTCWLKKVVSRKKQIVPQLMSATQNM